jgi:adenylate cyclase
METFKKRNYETLTKEIERKFIVNNIDVLIGKVGRHIVQGYLKEKDINLEVEKIDSACYLRLTSCYYDDKVCLLSKEIPVRDGLLLIGNYGTETSFNKFKLNRVGENALVIRVRCFDNAAYLTLKGPISGIMCDEFECPIPIDEALLMLDRYCSEGKIQKVRYDIPFEGHKFEIDVFGSHLEGLVIAEVEISNINEYVSLPFWIGKEVSTDNRYKNVILAKSSIPKVL